MVWLAKSIFSHWVLNHVFTEANYYADWIANYGHQTGNEFVLFDVFQWALLYFVEADARGIFYSFM